MLRKILNDVKGRLERTIDSTRFSDAEPVAALIRERLKADRSKFKMADFAAQTGIRPALIRTAAELVYTEQVERRMADGQIDDGDEDQLRRVAAVLEVAPDVSQRVHRKAAEDRFLSALVKATGDGVLTDEEWSRLVSFARLAGGSVPEMTRDRFPAQADGLLRAAFTRVQRSQDPRPGIASFQDLAKKLGYSADEQRRILSVQFDAFATRVMADATIDGHIDEHERVTLDAIMRSLPVDPALLKRVRDEIHRVNALHDLSLGRLPKVTVSSFILDPGEQGHWEGNAMLSRERRTRNGPVVDQVAGRLAITDTRLLFTSDVVSHQFKLRSVLSFSSAGANFRIEDGGRSAGEFALPRGETLAPAILRAAIAIAKQLKVPRDDHAEMRRIPRDVRQRVWARDGGRCVECGATQYLEFDHIVPVSRGGNNGEKNVQLLCRGCNGAKSDRI